MIFVLRQENRGSLHYDLHKVFEVRDESNLLSKNLLSLDIRANRTAKLLVSAVADAWVDAANAAVLVLAPVRQKVLFHLHEVVVEELLSDEGALGVATREVALGRGDVEAQVVTAAHRVDPLLANLLGDISSSALA